MKQRILFLSLFVLLLSCHKDDTPPAGSKKLTKLVTNDGTTTTTTLFGYDGNGKLAGLRQTQTDGGSSNESGFRIVRKADGTIDKLVSKQDGNRDSVTVAFTASGQQYTSTQWTETLGYGSMTHKVNFTYDGQGRLSQATTIDIEGSGPPDPQERYEFGYQGSNLASVKVYRISGGTNNLFYDYSFEYDQKTNPVPLGVEGLLFSLTGNDQLFPLSSPNNITKLTLMQIGSSYPDYVYTLTYAYNDQNMPLSATARTTGPVNSTETIAYIYE